MEVKIKTNIGGYEETVVLTCKCGKCSLLSTKQLADFRKKAAGFEGNELPAEMQVICN